MYGIAILVLMFVLAGCSPPTTREVKEVKKIDTEFIKKAAIKKCTKWKEEEYNWKPEEIKEYCTEMWRGYRD